VAQALEIKAKAVYRRMLENPCVGGSTPAQASIQMSHFLTTVAFLLNLNYCMHIIAQVLLNK
jgi:hypothetical protein